jgi:hypothetical protein
MHDSPYKDVIPGKRQTSALGVGQHLTFPEPVIFRQDRVRGRILNEDQEDHLCGL